MTVRVLVGSLLVAMLSASSAAGETDSTATGAAATDEKLTAARRKRPDIAATAVARGADVNARHPVLGTPLAAAVAMSDADTVAILLSAGVDRKSASVEQTKIERIAGERLNDLRVAELVGSIGSPDVRDEHGLTPLFRLAQLGDVGGVTTLLHFGVNPAATVRRWPGDDGWTAMMAAAANGHTAVVERLLAAGAPVDQRNDAGRTALGFAAFYGRAQTVVVLLNAGADPNAADRVGLTPRRLAQAGGEPVTIDLLRDRSASLPDVAGPR